MTKEQQKAFKALNDKVSTLETLAQMLLSGCHDARALAAGIGTPAAALRGPKIKGPLSEAEVQKAILRHRSKNPQAA